MLGDGMFQILFVVIIGVFGILFCLFYYMSSDTQQSSDYKINKSCLESHSEEHKYFVQGFAEDKK